MNIYLVLTIAVSLFIRSPEASAGFFKWDPVGQSKAKSDSKAKTAAGAKNASASQSGSLLSGEQLSDTQKCGAALLKISAPGVDPQKVLTENGCDPKKLGLDVSKTSVAGKGLKAADPKETKSSSGELVGNSQPNKCPEALTQLSVKFPNANQKKSEEFLKANGCDFEGLAGTETDSPVVAREFIEVKLCGRGESEKSTAKHKNCYEELIKYADTTGWDKTTCKDNLSKECLQNFKALQVYNTFNGDGLKGKIAVVKAACVEEETRNTLQCYNDYLVKKQINCEGNNKLTTKESKDACIVMGIRPDLVALDEAKFGQCLKTSAQPSAKVACLAGSAGSIDGKEDSSEFELVAKAKLNFKSGDAGAVEYTDLKGKIKNNKMARICNRAIEKGMKKLPDASDEEAQAFVKKEGCDLDALAGAIAENSACTKIVSEFKASNAKNAGLQKPFEKDASEAYEKKADKMCSHGATVADIGSLNSCYTTAKNAGTDKKSFNKEFDACITGVHLDDKYDIRSAGAVIANQFSSVAGCEEEYKKKATQPDAYQKCVVGRVGQEAAKAIFAELAKEGGMVGALASVGMEVTSCIQNKAVKDAYKEQGAITQPEQFCRYLEPGLSSATLPTTIIQSCPTYVKRCDKYAKDKNQELLYACGNAVVGCLKTNTTGGAVESCVMTAFSDLAAKEYSVDRGSKDPSFKQQMCLAGAGMAGVKALTSAYCADEKKFPTSADKEKCLKDARFINEIGQAGANVAHCMESGPGPSEKRTYDAIMAKSPSARTEPDESFLKKYSTKQKDRDVCLVDRLGDQAVAGIADALKLNEDQRALLGAGKNALDAVMDCKRLTDVKEKRDCWTRAGFDTASELLGSQIKDPTQRAIALGIVSGAKGMAMCKGMTGKEMQACVVQASLSGLGQMPGVVGEVAKLASATQGVVQSIQKCKEAGANQRDCMMDQIANIIPGNAGVYSRYAVKAWTLLKQENTCGTPSKYVMKASGLVALTGDVAVQVLHQVNTNKMKKEFGSLVNEEKARSATGLYENIDSVINKNNKNRDDEQIKEGASGNTQTMAMTYKRKTEENVLKGQLLNRPFFITSNVLNTVGTTMGIFEVFAETASDTTKVAGGSAVAPWLECERAKLVADSGLAPERPRSIDATRELRKIVRNSEYSRFNKDLPAGSFRNAYAHYVDLERFMEGDNVSMGLDEYERLKHLDDIIKDETVIDTLRYIVSSEFKLVSDAGAFDLGSVENIGTSMVSGLFPSKDGFKMGEPGAYAEDITYKIIKTGLNNLCQEKGKKDGECQYTGKATIELAAKTAAKALLVANKKVVDKVMRSAFGRIVIAADNAYNLTKTLIENEKMIADQRNRIDALRVIEKEMEKTGSLNWKKFLNFDLIQNAYAAKAVDPAMNMKLCVGKNEALDFKCGCKGTGCYEVFPMKNPTFMKNMNFVAVNSKEAYALTGSTMNQTANITNQLLNGNIGTEEIDLADMQKKNDSLNSINTKLLGRLATFMKDQGQKPFDLNTELAAHQKVMFASLHPDLTRTIERMGLNEVKGDPEKAVKALPDLASDKTKPDGALEASAVDVAIESAEAAIDPAAQRAALVKAELDKKYQENMNSEFEVNDISTVKSDSIFEMISKRYFKKSLEP